MADLLALADDEAPALWADLRLGYAESPGHPLLRAEIAGAVRPLEPDDILVFAGAEEAIFCLSRVLARPGRPRRRDLARLPEPVRGRPGGRRRGHPPRAARGRRLGARRRAPVAAFRPETRLVVVNAPHNPTGMLPEPGGVARLGDACADRGVPPPGRRGLSLPRARRRRAAARGADLFELGISMGVMSKSFALAGLRIGWLATRDRDLLARCARVKDYTTICSVGALRDPRPSSPSGRGTRVLARSRAIVAANLARFDDLPRSARPGSASRGSGRAAGSIGFPTAAGRPRRIDAFAARLVDAEGVLLLPGTHLRPPGKPLAGRARSGEPAGCPRTARGVPPGAADRLTARSVRGHRRGIRARAGDRVARRQPARRQVSGPRAGPQARPAGARGRRRAGAHARRPARRRPRRSRPGGGRSACRPR